MTQDERRIYLLKKLTAELPDLRKPSVPDDVQEQKFLLRGLMNIRAPKPVSSGFLRVQDEYLKERLKSINITDIEDLTPLKHGIYLWQGDITALKCDAVVNAANSGLTGCYAPNHKCIDNCIHTFAGIQLRLECESIIEKQGYEEPAGQAKITKAYNLPCKYVLHTVGPVIEGKLTQQDCSLLASCYKSCLELAAENGIASIAFCCISTGVFHFPNEEAAEIAVKEVEEFLKKETSVKKVVFNVFKDIDRDIYTRLLK